MKFAHPARKRVLVLLPALAAVLAAFLFALPALSEVPEAPAAPDAGIDASLHREFQDELAAVFAREEQQLAALQAEFDAAVDEEQALAVQRRIAVVRQSTELEMLGCQARYARRLGRVEQAQSIEADIAELRDAKRAEKNARPVESRP